jgi:hypothetical protein
MDIEEQKAPEKLSSLKDILATKKSGVKPPAYLWQDLALKIERELRVPAFKRSSVFKVCRDYPRTVIERCLADTKELCTSGEQWRYFFKAVTASQNDNGSPHGQPQTAPHN